MRPQDYSNDAEAFLNDGLQWYEIVKGV